MVENALDVGGVTICTIIENGNQFQKVIHMTRMICRMMLEPSLVSQTLYRLVPARSEGSGHPCTHFW